MWSAKRKKKDEASGRQQRDVGGRNSSGNLAARYFAQLALYQGEALGGRCDGDSSRTGLSIMGGPIAQGCPSMAYCTLNDQRD